MSSNPILAILVPKKLNWSRLRLCLVAFFALPRIYGGDMNAAANKARSMSAVMLIFYLMPLLVFYSAVRLETDHLRRCLNGHRLSAHAKHCEECGAPPGS